MTYAVVRRVPENMKTPTFTYLTGTALTMAVFETLWKKIMTNIISPLFPQSEIGNLKIRNFYILNINTFLQCDLLAKPKGLIHWFDQWVISFTNLEECIMDIITMHCPPLLKKKEQIFEDQIHFMLCKIWLIPRAWTLNPGARNFTI